MRGKGREAMNRKAVLAVIVLAAFACANRSVAQSGTGVPPVIQDVHATIKGKPSVNHAQDARAILDARVRAEIASFKGKVFLFARNLDTLESYSLNGDEPVRTASTI